MKVLIFVISYAALLTLDGVPESGTTNVLIRISEELLTTLKLISYVCKELNTNTLFLISVCIIPYSN